MEHKIDVKFSCDALCSVFLFIVHQRDNNRGRRGACGIIGRAIPSSRLLLLPTRATNYAAVQIIARRVEEIAGIVNSEGQYKIEKATPGDVIFLGKRLACVEENFSL